MSEYSEYSLYEASASSSSLSASETDVDPEIIAETLRDKESLITNLESIIDELEGELEFLRTTYKVESPRAEDSETKRVLKGISYLSIDFGRLSAENLDLRAQLKAAQLEARRLHERCARKIHYSNVPILIDSTAQTESCGESPAPSGATTPSIPADPLTDSPLADVMAHSIGTLAEVEPSPTTVETLTVMRDQLRLLGKENEQLRQLAAEHKTSTAELFANLRQQLQTAIPAFSEKLLRRYQEEVELRRALHNTLIELRGNIRVFCRVKPGAASAQLQFDPLDADSLTVLTDPNSTAKRFLFDKLFGMEATQSDVFDEVSPLIQSCLDGKNVSIFAYGHTGSGKTHTMEGPENDPGISRRVAHELFYLLAAKEESIQWELHCGMIEIYNERIRDLLLTDVEPQVAAAAPRVRNDGEGRPEILGIRRVGVRTVADLHSLISVGHKNRSTATTALNHCSSRSHALIMITVRMIDRDANTEWTGRLNLVDLAGSERVARSQVSGAQLQEAKFINKSLAELGNVVLALRRNQAHVPFRNCLLTRILEDSLTGDSKTLTIVQITTDPQHLSESVSSLNFAEKISNITRRPKAAATGSIGRRPNGA